MVLLVSKIFLKRNDSCIFPIFKSSSKKYLKELFEVMSVALSAIDMRYVSLITIIYNPSLVPGVSSRKKLNRIIVDGMQHFLQLGRTGKVFNFREWNSWKSRYS